MSDELQRRLASHIAEALAHHHAAQYPDAKEARKTERVEFMEFMEGEAVDVIKDMLQPLLDQCGMDEHCRRVMTQMLEPDHPVQLALLLPVIAAVGYIFGQAAMAGPTSTLMMSSMRAYGSFPIDPSALAVAANSKRLAFNVAEDRARDSGVSVDKFNDMRDMAIQHLTPSEAMVIARRFPSEETALTTALDGAGLADEDKSWFKMLRYGPPGPAEALNMATQNIIDMPTLQDLLQQGGIGAEWAQRLFESSGATMPPEMAVRLFREKRITVEQYEQILLESNLKNKYVPMMKWLQFRPPPMEQTLRMRRNGIATREEAISILEQDGFETYWATKLVDQAEKQATGSARDLTTSTMIDLYEVGKWDRAKTASALMGAGYDAMEAEDLLALADARKEIQQQNRGASKIHSRYVMWKIDRNEALNALNQIGIPPAQVSEALDIWDVERDAQTLHLTRVDIKKAVQGKHLTVDQGRARLLGMGYEPSDVAVIEKIDSWT